MNAEVEKVMLGKVQHEKSPVEDQGKQVEMRSIEPHVCGTRLSMRDSNQAQDSAGRAVFPLLMPRAGTAQRGR